MRVPRIILLFSIICVNGVAQINLSSGLTACYALDGSASEPINNLLGIISNSVTPSSDRNGLTNRALNFPGIAGQVVRLPNSPLLKPGSDISISGWFKMPTIQWMIAVFTKNMWMSYFTAYSITIQQAGSDYRFRCYRQNGTGDNVVTSLTPIQPNVWYHVVFCISETNMALYVNGALEATLQNTITNFNFDGSRNVILGGTNESNFDRPYTGIIDNVRFYNRMLTSTEVLALYTSDPSCLKQEPTQLKMEEEISTNDMMVFPNPFTDTFTITGAAEMQVQMKDIAGRTIPISVEGRNIKMTENSPGIYFLEIRTPGCTKLCKIIKL